MKIKHRTAIATVVLVALVGSAFLLQHFGPPLTLNQAVKHVYDRWLTSEDRDKILRMPKDMASVELHMSLGLSIRNKFGLWGYNEPLRISCGSHHPDDCSGKIIDELWHRIRRNAESGLVERLDKQFDLTTRIKIDYSRFNLIKIGDLLSSIQAQIDSQTGYDPSMPSRPLSLKIIGDANLDGYTRAEIAEPEAEPDSLEHLIGWIGWRNGFSARHNPPFIELRFHNPYAWPEPPIQFENWRSARSANK